MGIGFRESSSIWPYFSELLSFTQINPDIALGLKMGYTPTNVLLKRVNEYNSIWQCVKTLYPW